MKERRKAKEKSIGHDDSKTTTKSMLDVVEYNCWFCCMTSTTVGFFLCTMSSNFNLLPARQENILGFFLKSAREIDNVSPQVPGFGFCFCLKTLKGTSMCLHQMQGGGPPPCMLFCSEKTKKTGTKA